jgi:hypothetical protein
MKITVVYQSGSIVQYKVLEIHDDSDTESVWQAMQESGIYDGDVWHIFKGECVPV